MNLDERWEEFYKQTYTNLGKNLDESNRLSVKMIFYAGLWSSLRYMVDDLASFPEAEAALKLQEAMTNCQFEINHMIAAKFAQLKKAKDEKVNP